MNRVGNFETQLMVIFPYFWGDDSGMFWDDLGMFWGCVGMILGCFQDVWGMFRDDFAVILGRFRGNLGFHY